jgi:hypothetical protein
MIDDQEIFEIVLFVLVCPLILPLIMKKEDQDD